MGRRRSKEIEPRRNPERQLEHYFDHRERAHGWDDLYEAESSAAEVRGHEGLSAMVFLGVDHQVGHRAGSRSISRSAANRH